MTTVRQTLAALAEQARAHPLLTALVAPEGQHFGELVAMADDFERSGSVSFSAEDAGFAVYAARVVYDRLYGARIALQTIDDNRAVMVGNMERGIWALVSLFDTMTHRRVTDTRRAAGMRGEPMDSVA